VSTAPSDFEVIFQALELAGVRFLVVGGVAVVLHGHARFTADLDLVVALDGENVHAFAAAVSALGYRPRAPVQASELADPEKRHAWNEEKGLTVLSFWSSQHPATEIDVFVEEPFPMQSALERALHVRLGDLSVPVASISDLIDLKRKSARPKDLDDIQALEILRAEEDGDG
jgi:hypothetical protein